MIDLFGCVHIPVLWKDYEKSHDKRILLVSEH
jgi:hypothetical protein